MSLPPLPKNFASAVDLSSLGKPKVDAAKIPGIAIREENFAKDVLPISSKKVVIVLCWSPRSSQAIELLEVMDKFNQSDLLEDGEPAWVFATVNVDEEPKVSQVLQVKSVPLVIALIQEQLVPLFESVPAKDQIRLVIDKVLSLASERGVGKALTNTGPSEIPLEPEEIESMAAMEKGDYRSAKLSYEKLLARKPGENMAKLGLAQTQLLIRIEGLNPQDTLAKANANKSDLALVISAADIEIATGQNKAAFDRLISFIKVAESDEKKSAREHLLELFILVDPGDPELAKARQNLASALF